MARRQHVGAELLGGVEKIAELDLLIAGHARDRRLAGGVALGKAVDHGRGKAALVVEHVMRNAERICNPAGIVDVLAGAAAALAAGGAAVIVKLQGDADDVVTRLVHQTGDDGGVHAARHGHDNTQTLAGRLASRGRVCNAGGVVFNHA